MARSDFTRTILSFHDNQPQQRHLVNLALRGLYDALDELAKYGHPLKVVEADGRDEGLEWPKMLYHPQIAPGGKVFHEFEKPSEPGWTDQPVGAEPNPEPENNPQDLARQDGSATSASYPKKLYHRDIPGGVSVMNAEMEDDYKTRGYTDVPQERGDVDFGSRTRELEREDTQTGISPADGQGAKRSAPVDLKAKAGAQPNPTKQTAVKAEGSTSGDAGGKTSESK